MGLHFNSKTISLIKILRVDAISCQWPILVGFTALDDLSYTLNEGKKVVK